MRSSFSARMMFAISAFLFFYVVLSISAHHLQDTARADPPALTPSNWLPVIIRPQEPTATFTPTPTSTPETRPTRTPMPTPNAACVQSAPPPSEGPQAWMTVYHPAQGANTTLCARLIVNLQPVSGAIIIAVAHYQTGDVNLGPATTGTDGIGAITFNVGTAVSGYPVIIDVTITYNGQRYTAQTVFTPIY